MRTYDDLFDEIIALPNLYHAYVDARKGKNDPLYREFNKNLHENLWKLHEDLRDKAYVPSSYTIFYVNDYKKRKIMAPHFRDHIVHHAIYNYLEQIYDSIFIYDSFACRKGKGTHKSFFRLKKALNKYSTDDYFMKCDITKYFNSIDHHTLMSIIGKKITDKKLLWLMGEIINSHTEESSPSHIFNSHCKEQQKGIPIGNLTSQLFANIYLNELDYFVKHDLRVKHYVRYVDDFIILGKDVKCLHNIWQEIHIFLENQLYLKLEPRKTQINKISFGADFVGYVAFKGCVRVRTKNYQRFRRKLKLRIEKYHQGKITFSSLDASFVSYLGHLSHTNSNRIRENIKEEHLMVTTSAVAPSFGAGIGTMDRMQVPLSST
jgi:retron-type reverse transcriptase